jgi:hypothetical protein
MENRLKAMAWYDSLDQTTKVIMLAFNFPGRISGTITNAEIEELYNQINTN